MKAVLYKAYGSPDVLQLTDVPKPVPQADEVLVKILAAGTNPLDWHRMRGAPFLVRTSEGWREPMNPKLGADFAGIVEAVGSDVTEFRIGDEVFGSAGSGGFAEYIAVREKRLALKPENISFEAAASVGVAGFTALQGLRDKAQLQAGETVLINGAAGGVGTFAVQIAKLLGGEVTAVCSTRNLDFVRSIGADHALDYTREDFTRSGKQYDLIFDVIGNRSAWAQRRALKPNGRSSIVGFMSILSALEHIVVGGLIARWSDKKIGMMGLASTNKDDLLILKEMLETGKIVPVIDRCYDLSETAEAIRYLETGHARGKVIITM